MAGIVWCNLFADWPSGSVHCLVCGVPRWTVDRTVCSSVVHTDSCPDSPEIGRASATTSVVRRVADVARMAMPNLMSFTAESRAVARINGAHPALSWSSGVCPDVCVSMLGSARVARLASLVVARLRTPFVPYFQDNWLDTLYTRSVFTGSLRRSFLKDVDNLMSRAPFALAVSEEMACEYAKRFRIPFRVISNCCSTSSASGNAAFEHGRSEGRANVVFVYSGNLYLGRAKLLLEVAEAIEMLRNGGVSVELRVFCGEADRLRHGKNLSRCAGVSVREWVLPERLQQELLAADVGVHLDDFSEIHRDYLKYSFGAKVPEYLAARLPILSYAPEGFAVPQFVSRTGTGWVVGKHSRNLLMSAVRTAALDSDARQSRAALAAEQAAGQFSPREVRHRLRTAMQDAACPKPPTPLSDSRQS